MQRKENLRTSTIHDRQYCTLPDIPISDVTVLQALGQLLEIAQGKETAAYDEETLCVGIARVGSPDQQISFGSMEKLKNVDFGPPLHSLIITGDLHPLELEFLKTFKV